MRSNDTTLAARNARRLRRYYNRAEIFAQIFARLENHATTQPAYIRALESGHRVYRRLHALPISLPDLLP